MRAQKRALDKIFKRRDRYEIPDYQREEVWSKERQRELIDTILNGWKIPKLYFVKNSGSPTTYEVVDGQQRLNTIWSFMSGDLILTKDQGEKYGARTYNELPDELSDDFDDFELEYDEITDADEEEIKLFFQRLQNGLPLNSSEKLNSVHSDLTNYCRNVAKRKFFSETIKVHNKRYAHFDIASKCAVIELEDLDTSLRFNDMKDVFESNRKFSKNSAVAKRIDKAISFLHDALPKSYSLLSNRTVVQSLVTFVCELHKAGISDLDKTKVASFIDWFLKSLRSQVELGQNATDADFLKFQRTVNANTRGGARIRQEVMMRKLLQRHPDFFSNSSQIEIVIPGVKKSIKDIARDIAETVSIVNERYKADTGKDFFSMTGKTTKALAAIGKPVTSLDKFEKFISNLYFLFKEGPGNRISEPPKSYVDVNTLRTGFQHDVDHGSKSKMKAKNKKIGEVTAKYAGVKSLAGADPSILTIAQANILKGILSDTVSLGKSMV